MVPDQPWYDFTGDPARIAMPPLPGSIGARPIAPGDPSVLPMLNQLDRTALGFERPADHAAFGALGRQGFIYRDEAADRVIGYGYLSPSGQLGPVASDDPALLAAFVGHLTRQISPGGVFATIVPGSATHTFRSLLGAGFRIDGHPALFATSHPRSGFGGGYYLPMGYALP